MTKRGLVEQEDRAWAELREALAGLPREMVLEPGYTAEWSVKDLLAHLACWLAEGAQALQQMRLGSYREEDLDVEALNRRFWEACRELELDDVWAQLHSARGRLLEELDLLPEEWLEERAERWFADNATDHYREHLPRLRAWLEESVR